MSDDDDDDEPTKVPAVPELDPQPRVYLAGTVEWREGVIDRFGDRIKFQNPLGKYDCDLDELTILPGHQDGGDPTTIGAADIIETDKELLRNSDAVLVGYGRSHGSVGTPTEVLFAYARDKPVALCIQDDTMHHEIPAWYRYHITAQFSNPRLALRYLCLKVRRSRETDGGGE